MNAVEGDVMFNVTVTCRVLWVVFVCFSVPHPGDLKEMVMEKPSPLLVGREFVRQYYTLLNKAPDYLHRWEQLSWGDATQTVQNGDGHVTNRCCLSSVHKYSLMLFISVCQLFTSMQHEWLLHIRSRVKQQHMITSRSLSGYVTLRWLLWDVSASAGNFSHADGHYIDRWLSGFLKELLWDFAWLLWQRQYDLKPASDCSTDTTRFITVTWNTFMCFALWLCDVF